MAGSFFPDSSSGVILFALSVAVLSVLRRCAGDLLCHCCQWMGFSGCPESMEAHSTRVLFLPRESGVDDRLHEMFARRPIRYVESAAPEFREQGLTKL